MWIMPWIRSADKKGVYRILVFKYDGAGLWEADDPAHLTEEYLEPNGLGQPGPASFWSASREIWFPQIDAAADLTDFYFEKDQPATNVLRWSVLYWTKEDLGVNEFHKRQLLADGSTSVWDFLTGALSVTPAASKK